MKKFYLVFIFILFFSTNLFAEYKLEPANCTLKKNLTVEHIYTTVIQGHHIIVTQRNAKK